MNELDLKTKIEGLEKAIKEHKDFTGTYESQLKETQKQLEDYNKPELTSAQLDDIQCAIEEGIENFNFSDSENYHKEFGIDYDGRVTLESLELNDTYELTEMIVSKVHSLFKETLDTTEEDNHKPVE